jgi:hypothetical protein
MHKFLILPYPIVIYYIPILVVYIYGESIFMYNIQIHNTIKVLNVFIRSEYRSRVTDILQMNRAGINLFEALVESILSTAPEVVHSYRTGRTIIPEFVTRLLAMTDVPDSTAKK